MSDRPDTPPPPVAKQVPSARDLHGVSRPDDYAWMHSDRDALIDYLRAERQHYDEVTAKHRDLQDVLFSEMSGRLAPADDSVSWRHHDRRYFWRTLEGKQYQQLCREGPEDEVLLDLNTLAEGSAYLALGVREVSPDGRLLAYSVDTDG